MDKRNLPIRARAPTHQMARQSDSEHEPTLDNGVKQDRLSDGGTLDEQERNEAVEDEKVDESTIKAYVDGKFVSDEDLKRIGKELAEYNCLNAVPSVALLREMNDYRRLMGPTSLPFECYSWIMFLKEHSPPEILEEDVDMDDSKLDWWWLKKDGKDGVKDEGGENNSDGKDSDDGKKNSDIEMNDRDKTDGEENNDGNKNKDSGEDEGRDKEEDSDSEEDLAPWEWREGFSAKS